MGKQTLPRSEDERGGDYENVVLTQLYSRKMTRQNFNRVRTAFKSETGRDLCTIIAKAHDDMAKKIVATPDASLADKLRTDTFKMLDYSIWLGFCERVKKR